MRTVRQTILVAPAYGRSYKNRDEAVKAWIGGMDFVCLVAGSDWGRYCSIRDFDKTTTLVEIRSDRYRLGNRYTYLYNPEENQT